MGRGGPNDLKATRSYTGRENPRHWGDESDDYDSAVGSQDLRASTEDPGLRLQGGHQRAGNLGRIGSPRNVCTKGSLYQLPDCEPSIATECVHERTEGLERQIADTDVSHSAVKHLVS